MAAFEISRARFAAAIQNHPVTVSQPLSTCQMVATPSHMTYLIDELILTVAQLRSDTLEHLAPLLSSFDILPHVGVLLVAYLLALPIGWDREKSERSAGLRTFPLVAIASCGFIQATEGLTHGSAEATARIGEGLITGMGFIGGGAILVVTASVRGTATAASLWATGAIGTAVGLGLTI